MFRKRFADNTSDHSVATRLRRQRFRILLTMLDDFSGPVQILDVGGRPQYWESMTAELEVDKPLHVTLLNLSRYPVSQHGVTSVVGDGRGMPQYADGQFDIVFSNSTIEHVGTADDQMRMADEVRRVGKAYYIQTPNRYFPIEPHFLFPFFQFLPLAVRAWLVSHFALGWYHKIPDREKARQEVDMIRLLTRKDVEQLFPGATIYEERYGGVIKSFVAYRGKSRRTYSSRL